MRTSLRVAALALLLAVALAQDDTVPVLSQGLLKDREGLLALKSKISSFGTSQMESWRASGNPCLPIAWSHVTCSTGDDPRVIGLNLANRGVVGELAVGLRKAGRLEVINLENNRFSGNIPNDWAKGNTLTRLRILNLANNELTGVLPIWNRRGAWRALEVVDLSNNKFYGGLPTNWLGKFRPLKTVRYLSLSNNLLGTSDGVTPYATQAGWCAPEGSLKAGSGWCPADTNAPLVGTAPSLVTLDLANNGFVGEVPPKWPTMFPRLQYLKLQFNDLYYMSETLYKIPTALPGNWTTGAERGFPSLSVLTLYPGNDYLCALPDDDGSFQDVNLAATYQVADVNGETYGDGNPHLCPTGYTEDHAVTGLALTASQATWSYTINKPAYIWGFKVTVSVHDKEAEEWSPLPNANGVLLRVYTLGMDGSSSPTTGLGVVGSAYTLSFGTISPNIDLSGTTWPKADYDKFKIEVSIIDMDNVENSAAMVEFTNP